MMKQDLNSKMIQELNRNDEIEVDIRKQQKIKSALEEKYNALLEAVQQVQMKR